MARDYAHTSWHKLQKTSIRVLLFESLACFKDLLYAVRVLSSITLSSVVSVSAFVTFRRFAQLVMTEIG